MQQRSLILICAAAALLSACTAASLDMHKSLKRGEVVYTKECAQCHGPAGQGGGPASLGLGLAPPSLTELTQRNDGAFPREFVRRYVMGSLEKEDTTSPMPEFATEGLRHVYPNGGADGEVLEADFEALLHYLNSIQI